MIQRWTETANYTGQNYGEYFIAAQRFFRCSKQEEATFAYIREHLLDLGPGEANATIVRARLQAGFSHQDSYRDLPAAHQAVLDVTFSDECYISRYLVLVHKDFERGVRMASMFEDRLCRKGYVDPDAADANDEEESTHQPDASFNAAPVTGSYAIIKLGDGRFTTISAERKNHTRDREAAKRALLLQELGTSPVARKIDGIYRRWNAVPATQNDDHQVEQVEK